MSAFDSEEAFEGLMEDMQVLYSLKAGQTVTQADVDALNRLDAHYRENEESATDVYHRAFGEGVAHAGGSDLKALSDKLDEAHAELSCERTMTLLARTQADRFEASLAQIGRMVLFPDDQINRTTLQAAIHLARAVLGSRLADGALQPRRTTPPQLSEPSPSPTPSDKEGGQ